MDEPLSQDIDSNEARADEAWAQRCGVLNKTWVQMRYHRRRQRFFDLADKLTKSATVLLGASLLGQFLKDWLPLVASTISALGLLALVFGYGDRKQLHKELAEQAAGLICTIEEVPARKITFCQTAIWSANYIRLCAKAPPPLKTLSILCEYEQANADGNPNHVILPPWYRRMAANLIS